MSESDSGISTSGFLPPGVLETIYGKAIRPTSFMFLPPPTDEEKAEQQARYQQHVAALAAFIAELNGITDATASAVLELHSPSDGVAVWADCEGCDYAGYEGDAPAWPCRTVKMIAERHGIEVPHV